MKRTLALILTLSLTACTTTQAKKNVADAPGAVVDAPVKALNLKKKTIPPFLQELGNPYANSGRLTCSTLTVEVLRLTDFAGPDWDSDDHFTKQGRTTAEFVNAILPYGGIVRFISGASEHEKKVLIALNYAIVRRAHLKTLARRKGCQGPAKPKY